MDEVRQFFETVAAWLLMPATLAGGAGGILASVRKGETARRALFNGFSGAVVANVTFPLIVAYFPQPWHDTLLFLAGVGGLKMVNTVYGWIFDEGLLRDVLRSLLARMGGGK